MIEVVDKLIEIAEVTESHDYDMQLKRIKEMLKKREYLVSIMGQFSAGKSKLINNIVEKNIVPVHTTETTALITLIKYGEKEYAELIYKDGVVNEITIEQSLELWQDGKNEVLALIDMIIIYVSSSILSTGMVLADTPGINTVINEHLELAAYIMESSDRIMYLMGKPVTETDRNFINKIEKCGISVLFVRTHMDMVKFTEENVDISTEKEIEILQPYSKDKIFFLSNNNDSLYYNVIDELREYLQLNLADNLEKTIQETCKAKILRIAKDEQKTVNSIYNSVQKVLSGQETEYSEKKKELEENIKVLNNIFGKNAKKLKRKVEQMKLEAYMELERAKNKVIQETECILNEAYKGSNIEAYEALAAQVVNDKCIKIKDDYIECFNKILGENKKELAESLSVCQAGTEFIKYIPDDIEDSSIKMEEIRSKIIALKIAEENYNVEIGKLEAQKEQHIQEKEEINTKIDKIRIQKENIQKELKEYPEYEKQYKIVQEGTSNAENIMRRVGSIIDWVTILLPGKAYVGIAEKTLGKMGKIAGKIPNAGNIANKLAKTAENLQKSKNVKDIVSKTDNVLDVVKGIKNISDNDMNIQEKEGIGKILQLFTLEYHLGNIGKKFDKKEIIEVDKDYEMRYRIGKKEIQNRIKESTHEEMKKRNTILKINDKIEKAKMEEKIYRNKYSTAEKEIEELKKQLEEEKEKEIIKRIKNHYIEESSNNIEKICKKIISETGEHIEKSIEDYITASSTLIIGKIKSKENEIKNLEEFLVSASKKELEEKENLCQEYIRYLDCLFESI